MTTFSTTARAVPNFPAQITLEALWRRRGIFVLSLIVSLSLGAVYLATARPTYQVKARLLVEERSKPLEHSQRPGDNKDFLPTQAEIIRSPAVIQQVVEALAIVPGPDGGSPVLDIVDHLQADPLVGTDVLSLNFQDSSPTIAIEKLQAVIAAYQGYIKTSEQGTYRQTITLLTEREKQLRDDLNQLHANLIELRKQSPYMSEDRAASGIQRTVLSGIGQSLTATKSRSVQLQSLLKEMTAFRDAELAASESRRIFPTGLDTGRGPTDVASGSTGYSGGESRGDWLAAVEVLSRVVRGGLASLEDPAPTQQALLEAQSRAMELSQRFGPKHPELRGARVLIASLEGRLRRTVMEAPVVLDREIESLGDEEASLIELYNQELAAVKGADEFYLKEQKTREDIDRLQQIHGSIVSKLNDSQLADQALSGGRASVSVKVLDGPQLVNDQVWPQPVPLLGLCGLMGLAGGFVLVVLAEQFQRVAPTS
jgi:succinoglycan biosynthesis transport protein ExoP